jgi:hypothetical protein
MAIRFRSPSVLQWGWGLVETLVVLAPMRAAAGAMLGRFGMLDLFGRFLLFSVRLGVVGHVGLL